MIMKKHDATLHTLRSDIDKIDSQIILLISQRMDVVREIGLYKKTRKLKLLNTKRKSVVSNMWLKNAEALGLSPEFLRTIYCVVHDYALKIESDINTEE
jgi:chorismate mutase